MGDRDGCPACGALPCDWCWDPLTDKDSALAAANQRIAELEAKLAEMRQEPGVEELALIMFNAVNSGQVTDTFDRLSRQVQEHFYRAAKAVHRRLAARVRT